MTIDEAAGHLRGMLLAAGFRFNRPEPALAWEVFKRFVAMPVETAGGRANEEVWFEARDGQAEEGLVGYFRFVRQFLKKIRGDEFHERIAAQFTCEPTERAGIPEGCRVGVELAQLPGSFAAVETSPAFKAGLRFARWSFSVEVENWEDE